MQSQTREVMWPLLRSIVPIFLINRYTVHLCITQLPIMTLMQWSTQLPVRVQRQKFATELLIMGLDFFQTQKLTLKFENSTLLIPNPSPPPPQNKIDDRIRFTSFAINIRTKRNNLLQILNKRHGFFFITLVLLKLSHMVLTWAMRNLLRQNTITAHLKNGKRWREKWKKCYSKG